MQELMVVKQLPEIQANLKELSSEISQKVENAKNLVCTEENVKEIKKVRADLNKEFKEVEQQRKFIKEQILAPYMKFEEVYREYIFDKYKSADKDLKEKIDSIENELKLKKEQEIKSYFEEYKQANNIDFVEFEQAKINVTLSASMKSLKEQAKTFIDKIVDDLKLIETQEHKTEILVEYKQSLNISKAITSVINRFKAIEQEKQKQEETTKQRIEKELDVKEDVELDFLSVSEANNISFEIDQQKEFVFRIILSDEKLFKLEEFLNNENIQYEKEGK